MGKMSGSTSAKRRILASANPKAIKLRWGHIWSLMDRKICVTGMKRTARQQGKIRQESQTGAFGSCRFLEVLIEIVFSI